MNNQSICLNNSLNELRQSNELRSLNELRPFNELRQSNELRSLNELRSKRKNTITSYNRLKHLTKRYKKFRYLKEKGKKFDLDQFFINKRRLKNKDNKELNFSNFFSKLNELNKRNNLNDNLINNNELMNTNKNEEDSEHHLLELIKASSTITNHKIQRNQSIDNQLYSNITSLNKKELKKNLALKHKEQTIDLLNKFNCYDNKLKDNNFKLINDDLLIDYYLNKLKDNLTKDDQLKFLNLLEEFDLINRKLIDLINKFETKSDDEQNLKLKIKEIYFKIKKLLNDNELIDEFVLFMNYETIKQLDQQFNFNYWLRIKNFTQKLVIYLNENSNLLIRLIKQLKQLKQNEHDLIDKRRIKTILNKFLNSQPYLLNELNSLFIEEQPLDYLFTFNEDYDEIDLDDELFIQLKEQNNYFKQQFETINLNNIQDEEQTNLLCNCKICHHNQLDNNQLNNNQLNNNYHLNLKYCLSCNLKYCKTKIYSSQDNQKLFTSIDYIDKGDKEGEEDELL